MDECILIDPLLRYLQYLIIMCNSFGLTENYIVFMEQPLKIELRKFPVLTLLGKPFSAMMNWNPSENVRVNCTMSYIA